MRIFCVVSDVPFAAHSAPSISAVNIVDEVLLDEIQRAGHEIILQIIFNSHRNSAPLTPDESAQLDRLTARRVTVLPPLFSPPPTSASLVEKLSWSWRLSEFYPAVGLREEVEARLEKVRGVGTIFTLWSPEGVAATNGISSVPRVAFHGDAEPLVKISSRGFWGGLRSANYLRRFERAHLELMSTVSVIANVTASNAQYYRIHRHPKSIYVRNTWMSASAAQPAAKSATGPFEIIGHFGSLSATGGSMGLGFLLKGVVPALEKKLGGLDYRVHIIGGGRVKPELERYLKNNRIVVHGFVKDLDAMLDKSDAVLVLNNAEGAPQAYTRHLVAWSRGLCLIAHTRSRLAIPEIEPGRNALLGETPEQIAEAVRRALTDSLLNRRLRQQGHQTFETLFVPRVVARNLLESLPTNALPKS